MNKPLSIFLSLVCGVALFSCDDIKDNERFIELPAVEAKRVVLLEEFTGQNCINCPEAHEAIEKLLEQYSGNLISVSFHGGPLAIHVNKLPYGLANDESTAYWESNGRPDLPAGVVNRTSGVQTVDKWANSIRASLEKASNIDLAVKANLSDDKKTIEITTDANPHDNINGNLQLWVVESGIISRQSFPGGKTDSKYEHNHVFRATVNGIDGEKVTLTTREPRSFTHSIAIPYDAEYDEYEWDAKNVSIVAFIYNEKGVLQAAKADVEVASQPE